MTISNYVSIKAVLYQISLLIDERYWNETVMLEWATKALRSLQLPLSLIDRVEAIKLSDHKAQLPKCLKYLVQVGYLQNKVCSSSLNDELDLPENSSWCAVVGDRQFEITPMRLTSSPIAFALTKGYAQCPACKYEFSVSPSLVLTANVCDGELMVHYLAFPEDEEGYALIPDDEDVKTAITHYVLYMYWLSKMSMKEDGARNMVDFHLRQYQTALLKAKNLALPDTSTLENLKNDRNRLVPRTRQFESFFSKLNNQENVNF